MIETIRQDIQYSLRGMARQRTFTIAALLALTLGIGATTAVFSVVDLLLFRALPYTASDRLISLGVVAPIEQQEFMFGATYAQIRQGLHSIEAFTSWSGVSDCDITDKNPSHLRCARVESNFLPMLGMKLALGRHFTSDEDSTNGPRATAISYALWRDRFGSDPQIIGKTLSIDNQTWEIASVLTPDFEVPTLAAVDIVMPQRYEDARLRRQTSGPIPPLRVFARLRPGATIPEARAELEGPFQDSLKDVPPQFRREVKLLVRSLRDRQIQDAKLASWIFLGAVAAVLLIACANVANLLLARAASRRREILMRIALGASRRRILQQSMTESFLLALAGSLFGAVAAWALLKTIVVLAPDGIPRLQQAHIDLRVLLFTLAISLCCGVIFGLPPALGQTDRERLSGSRTIGPSRHRVREALIVLQIAVSLILLTGATLLLRTLWNMQRVPLGIEAENVLIARVSLNMQRYPQQTQCAAFFDDLETKLRQIGIASFAISDSTPPAGAARSHIFASLQGEGQPRTADGTGGMVVWRYVSPAYFDVFRIRIMKGRAFTEDDRTAAENRIVISEALAKRVFPGQDAIGKRMRNAADREDWLSVIGVAENVKNAGFAAADDPEYYTLRKRSSDPIASANNNGRVACNSNVIVRFSGSAGLVAASVRGAVESLDAALPVTTDLLQTRVRKLTASQTFNAALLCSFAAIGALLAAIGLYGVISFVVLQRTSEIGVRMALGASPSGILRMVLQYSTRLTLIATVLGVIGSLAATRLLHSMLFGIDERDPLTLVIATAVIVVVAATAAWIPSRRAARIDPLSALRCE